LKNLTLSVVLHILGLSEFLSDELSELKNLLLLGGEVKEHKVDDNYCYDK